MDNEMPFSDLTLQEPELARAFKEKLVRDDGTHNITPFNDRFISVGRFVQEHDVPEIHGEVRNRICELLEEIHDTQRPKIVVLAGDPGMGKSHLINYFRFAEPAAEHDYVMVSNSNSWRMTKSPLLDKQGKEKWQVSEFERCLLNWIVDALTRSNPEQKDLLGERIKDIAFAGLRDILVTQGIRGFQKGVMTNLLRRIWSRLTRTDVVRFQKAVADRDVSIFRELNFGDFADYLCEKYLAETGNPFHRYLMHVLLRYLFKEDQRAVVYWLWQRDVDDKFYTKLGLHGIKDTIDGHYKFFDVIKVLISLFAANVSKALADNGEAANVRDIVFFLAFDQTEGRNELFDTEDDWRDFFAKLCELFNAVPNLFILFTMTIKLRAELHPNLEKQFRQRIDFDPRFEIHRISNQDVCRLYEQRLRAWSNGVWDIAKYPYFPFDSGELNKEIELNSIDKRTLRGTLEYFDTSFRQHFEKVISYILIDYAYSLKEIKSQRLTSEYQFTKTHLLTVKELLSVFGSMLADSYGIHFCGYQELESKKKQKVLELKFSPEEESPLWVRIRLVRLPFQNYRTKERDSLELIKGRQIDKNRLCLVRVKPYALDTSLEDDPRILGHEIHSDIESCFRAVAKIAAQQEGYRNNEWQTGKEFLVQEIQKTYLGHLFEEARTMLQNAHSDEDIPEEDEELVTVNFNDSIADPDD